MGPVQGTHKKKTMENVRREVVQETISGQASILSEMVASQLQPILDRHEIGFGTFDMLAAVHAAKGALPQAAIARRMGISAASLTEAVKTGVRRELVTQETKDGDSRAKVLTLTKKGKTLLKECFEQLEKTEATVCKGISEEDLETALKVLKTSIANLATGG
jgi:DNA-binding MarR family transcriptional regulator